MKARTIKTILPAVALASLALAGCQRSGTSQSDQAATASPTAAATTDQSAQALTERERQVAQREAEVQQREQQLQGREGAMSGRSGPTTTRRSPTRSSSGYGSQGSGRVVPAPVDREGGLSEPRAARPARTAGVMVPAATSLDVQFDQGIGSDSSNVGDRFTASVARDVQVDGRVVIPACSQLSGVVTEARSPRRIGGQARLAVRFDDLRLPWGESEPIAASFSSSGKDKTKRDAATIGGGAAAGAILGNVINKNRDASRTKGAVIGGILGGVAGTVIAGTTPGEEVRIPTGAVVALHLDQDVTVHPGP